MQKKGDLSINVIVIAAIAMLVLVVMVYMVGSKLGWFARATGCGGAVEGVCAYSCEELGTNYRPIGTGSDVNCKPEQICCIKMPMLDSSE